jgi:hypothetical protein
VTDASTPEPRTPVARLWAAFIARTVWAPDALPRVQARFRWIFRVLLPVVDVVFILFGVVGFIIGSRVVETYTLHWYNAFWSATIGLAAIMALVGVVMMFDWVEMLAKLVLVVSVVWYTVLLAVSAADDSPSALLSIIVAVGFGLVPVARILDLIGEIARSQLVREHAIDMAERESTADE